MAAEAVKVIVRCRPMNDRERSLNCKTCVKMEASRGQCQIQNPADEKAPPKTFTFDGAYFMDSTTEQIYADIGYPLVEGVTEGYNGTIFAYGQTGCGKSFSMQGIQDPTTQRGIIPRAFEHIFETISVTEGTKFLVHASFLEIYNEEIRDLLGKDVKIKLDLKEHPEKGVYVQGLSKHTVHTVSDCERVMEKGWRNRSTGSTLMNADSSRSHSIFTINLEMANTDENGEDHIRAGKLNLVDLAGSERQAKTGATGDRLKEATKINLSLSALGNVISALVDGRSKHIPYRDSKLTRLLQDSLGGNTKTLMVACLSPADNNYDETLSTLRYANRAKNIKNKPKINEDPKDALLREYQEEIQKLKAMLMGQIPLPQGGLTGVPAAAAPAPPPPAPVPAPEVIEKVVVVDHSAEIEAEKLRIRKEYELQLASMQGKYEEEKVSKAKLQEDMSKLRQFYDSKLSLVEGKYTDLPPTAAVLGEDGYDLFQPADDERYENNVAPRAMTVQSVNSEVSSAPEIEEHSVVIVEGDDGGHEVGRGVDSVLSMADRQGETYSPQSPAPAAARQHAVHLGTTKHDVDLAPILATSSSTATPEQTAIIHQHEEALKKNEGNVASKDEALLRLQELQSQMVGGEAANNLEVKERRRVKRKHAEERKIKLAAANSHLEDDGIMEGIFDSIQDELKIKNKLLDKEKQRTESLRREIVDLQSEFEFDRIDYLDSIRRQDKQIKLLQSIIDKIHPCIRRDCNYSNLDRVKTECVWDEENERWRVPQLIVEKTALPTGMPVPGGRTNDKRLKQNGEYHENDRYRMILSQKNDDVATNYFQSRRSNQILTQQYGTRGETLSAGAGPPPSNFNMNGSRTALSWQQNGTVANGGEHNGSMSNEKLRAAHVHGQINTLEDLPIRKPARLTSLATPQTSASKKKKKKSPPADLEGVF
ncbi:osmotic avoidance abnormal protein 3-like [Tubulanus polymorphus]|uniref:osmotic avoidance abnormal protein 3-like n=1 Tax=Tubulanus polymorphus TaxID=672921 RepID=UPI003DA66988